PIADDLLLVGGFEVEMAEDAELVGMRLDRLDRLDVDRLAERRGRMQHRRIDPGFFHLGQRVVHIIGRNLPVMRRHLAVFPDVDLRIDDQHGFLLDTASLRPADLIRGDAISFRLGPLRREIAASLRSPQWPETSYRLAIATIINGYFEHRGGAPTL